MDPRALRDLKNDDLRARIDECESSLKEASATLADYEAKAAPLRAEISRQSQHLSTYRTELERRLRPAPEPRISDHALLRYIERVHGVNMEMLKAHILNPRIVAAIQAGASGVILDGVKFVINGFTIVTVLDDEQKFKRKTNKHGKIIDASEAIAEGIEDYADQVADGAVQAGAA